MKRKREVNMKKHTLWKRLAALSMSFALVFSLASCSDPAAGGSDPTPAVSATPAPVLSEEDYMAEYEALLTKMTDLQSTAASLDPTDLEAAKKLISDIKTPFVEFSAVTPPEKYADAHAKLQAGCDGMIEYIDILLQIAEETDTTKQQELATKMVEVLTTAATNMGEGADLLTTAG